MFAREDECSAEERRSQQLAAGEEEKSIPVQWSIASWGSRWLRPLSGWAWHGKAYRRRGQGLRGTDEAKAPPSTTRCYNKYYVDEAYDYAFTGRRKVGRRAPRRAGIRRGASWFDSHVIDAAVNAAGWMTRAHRHDFELVGQVDHRRHRGQWPGHPGPNVSYPARILQWGLVQWYALVMVAGLVGFMFYYVWH